MTWDFISPERWAEICKLCANGGPVVKVVWVDVAGTLIPCGEKEQQCATTEVRKDG